MVSSGALVGNLIEVNRYEKTMQEMKELSNYLTGNENLMQTGHRAGFGYFEQHRAFPATGDASWSYEFYNKPMVVSADANRPQDLLQDEWGKDYSFVNEATVLLESGGTDKTIGTGSDDLEYAWKREMYLNNTVRIYVKDARGSILRCNYDWKPRIPEDPVDIVYGYHTIRGCTMYGYGGVGQNSTRIWSAVTNTKKKIFGDMIRMTYSDGCYETTKVKAGIYRIRIGCSPGYGSTSSGEVGNQHVDNLSGATNPIFGIDVVGGYYTIIATDNEDYHFNKMIVVYPRGPGINQIYEIRFPGVIEQDEIGDYTYKYNTDL